MKMCGSEPVRVLLVDDHAALVEATAEFLKFAGLDVRTASDGKTGLAMAKAFRPQIILCDLRLPDISGLDLLKVIRADMKITDVVLALHTAIAEFELQAWGNQADIQVLSKPLTDEKLKRLLAALKNRRSS